MQDDTDFDRAERILGHELKGMAKLAALLNPETMLKVKEEPKPVARVINLQRKYDICTTHRPWLRDKGQHFECYDRETFDPDPESNWHIFGRGETSSEAVSDLLVQIGEQVARS
jgi:hypothetical protein